MCCSNPGSCSDAFSRGFAKIGDVFLVMDETYSPKYTAGEDNCQKTFYLTGRGSHYSSCLPDISAPLEPAMSNEQSAAIGKQALPGKKMSKKDRKERAEIAGSSEGRKPDPDLFHNHELSLLQFNARVLDEALDERNPLLERVKFIGIVCSNLDEFYQKRIGGLKRQVEAGVYKLSVDGLTPKKQLKQIRKVIRKMDKTIKKCLFEDLVPALAEQGIHFKGYRDLDGEQKKFVEDYYFKQIYPLLTPLAIDHSHPFPFISNKSLSLAVELHNPATGGTLFARLKVPSNLKRWIPVQDHGGELSVILIEDVIRNHLEHIFSGAEVLSSHVFRVTRNADISRNEEEAEDLLEMIEEELRERRFADIVRVEMEEDMPDHIKAMILKHLDLTEKDVFETDKPMGMADAAELYGLKGFEELRYKKWIPVPHPAFRHEGEEEPDPIFDVIKKGDVLVHHPYHSFSTSVERFVREAADDPDVMAIKQTIYRTSDDSPHLHALIRAAERGKQVAILVELKARFDEKRNIEWAQRLEKAGVHVAYGLSGLKIHSKLTVVVRKEGDGIRRYVHIGTGNYHPGTAQLYVDLGLFTCDPDIGADASDLFNLLTGFSPGQKYNKLVVAPRYLRDRMLSHVRFEKEQARSGKEARIIAKMNSLEDPEMIEELYDAARFGVKIDLIVRGVCRLRSGVKGTGGNITVHSIIGRYLEHSRIYCFHNAGDSRYYIGSADWMRRNLDKRVEVLAPVESGTIKSYLAFVLETYLNDNSQRWILQPDGDYERCSPEKDNTGKESPDRGAHCVFMEHAAGAKDPVPV